MTDAPEKTVSEQIAAITINYQTPDLLEEAVRSFKRAYPQVRLTIIDNGSRDHSRSVIEKLTAELPRTGADFLETNIYHGPAMDRGVLTTERPFVFVFDSDTVTERGGFLESMLEVIDENNRIYGIGHRVTVDQRGFARPTGIPVLSSAHMLLRTSVYRTLPPFVHHGLPALANFRAAEEAGYELLDWPIGDYVRHLGRGTAARYGYGLGLRSRLDYLLARLGL